MILEYTVREVPYSFQTYSNIFKFLSWIYTYGINYILHVSITTEQIVIVPAPY
jgi:hypothetical protein